MSHINTLKKIGEQFKEVAEKYGENINVESIVELDDILDELPILMKEIAKQPSLVAFALTLRKTANIALNRNEKIFEKLQTKYRKSAIEHLKFDKNVHITSKMIDAKVDEIGETKDDYKLAVAELEKSKARLQTAEMLVEVLRVREQTFKSLAYLMDPAIKAGLMYPSGRR